MKTLMFLEITLLLTFLFVPSCRGANESKGGHFPEYFRNCTGYTDNQLRALNLTSSASSIVSLVVITVIFVAALKHKTKRNLLDRLFLYLITVTEIGLVIVSLNIIQQIHFSSDGNFCKLVGFFTQYCGAIAAILNVVIAVSLLGTPYRYLIQKRPVQGERKGFETMLFVFVTIFPMSTSLIPFFDGGYGYSITSCWVRSFDESCIFVGYKSQLTIYSILAVHVAITIVLAVVMAVIYCVYGYWKFRNPQVAVLLRKSMLLVVFIFVRGVVILFIGIMQRFFISSFAYSVVSATILQPCLSLPLPLGYIIYLYTKFNPNRGCSCCCISARQRNAEAQPHDSHYLLANHGIPLATTMPANIPSNTQSLLPPDTGIGAATDIPADENNSPRDQTRPGRETDDDDEDCLCTFPSCCFTAQLGTEIPVATAMEHPNDNQVSAQSYTMPLPLEHTGIATITDAKSENHN